MVRPIAYAHTVLAVDRENLGLWSAYPTVIMLAAWTDGHIVWSRDRLWGGPPYYAGRVDPRAITATLMRFDADGIFAEPHLSPGTVKSTSRLTNIQLRFGTRALEMTTDHELSGEFHSGPRVESLARMSAEYLVFRLLWSETRRTIDALIPPSGEPTTGEPIKRGRLSWYEPNRAHDSRILRKPAESAELKDEEVSQRLRSALDGGNWPAGHGMAVGVGPDGAEYDATMTNGHVYVQDWDPNFGGWTPIAEPEGVVWKPVMPLSEPERPKLGEVSEGLRKALEEGVWPDGRRRAIGVRYYGPERLEYHAAVHGDRVHLEQVFDPISRTTVPVRSEPKDTVWKPRLPSRWRRWWSLLLQASRRAG
jgi:hypothetical protein